MIVAPTALLVIVRARPPRKANGLIGEFVKGLLHEFRTGEAVVDPDRLSTPFGDRADAGIRLELRGRLPAGPIGPERGRQARSTDVPGPGETGEQIVIGMLP